MKTHPEYGPQYDSSDGTVGETRLVKRWFLVKGDGSPFHSIQGVHTYETKERAEQLCAAFLKNYPPGSTKHHFVEGLHPEEWWCWPEHFDPIGPVNEETCDQYQ